MAAPPVLASAPHGGRRGGTLAAYKAATSLVGDGTFDAVVVAADG